MHAHLYMGIAFVNIALWREESIQTHAEPGGTAYSDP